MKLIWPRLTWACGLNILPHVFKKSVCVRVVQSQTRYCTFLSWSSCVDYVNYTSCKKKKATPTTARVIKVLYSLPSILKWSIRSLFVLLVPQPLRPTNNSNSWTRTFCLSAWSRLRSLAYKASCTSFHFLCFIFIRDSWVWPSVVGPMLDSLLITV